MNTSDLEVKELKLSNDVYVNLRNFFDEREAIVLFLESGSAKLDPEKVQKVYESTSAEDIPLIDEFLS